MTNKTNGRPPRLPFARIKQAVLGSRYELSLTFVPPRISERLHRVYQKKTGPANVLSFPLSKTTGEIFIDLSTARSEAVRFKRHFNQHVGALFIHGLLHLNGYRHGSKMEAKERRFREKFGIS